MDIVSIINKKKKKESLTEEEILFAVNGFVDGTIKDYQMSSLAMAILLNGMDANETSFLTKAFIESGDQINLTGINGVKVDKHSTGGVGDKVSLILGPLCAAMGMSVAKMSGRGLGHTGGTIDKLETFKGFTVEITPEDFIKQVNEIGLSIIAQSDKVTPADKKMYALRDVTGTVDSIPLIASSIMSKKIATGSDAILLDIKVGSGAFMKNKEQAKILAETMIDIGKSFDRDTKAIITYMDEPLGNNIGNSVEIYEAIETMKGNGPDDLNEIIIEFAATMALQSKLFTNYDEAVKVATETLKSGVCVDKFREFIKYQGGDTSLIDNHEELLKAKNIYEVVAHKDMNIKRIDALSIGELAMNLGAGRKTKEDAIDLFAGVIFHKTTGQSVKKGELIAKLYSNSIIDKKHEQHLFDAIEISDSVGKRSNVIIEKLS